MLEESGNQLIARYSEKGMIDAGTFFVGIGLLGCVLMFFLEGGPQPIVLIGNAVSILVGLGLRWSAKRQTTTLEKSGSVIITAQRYFGGPSQQRPYDASQITGVDYFEYSYGEFASYQGSKVSLILANKSRIKILDRRKTEGPLLFTEAKHVATFLNLPLHDGRGEWRQLGS